MFHRVPVLAFVFAAGLALPGQAASPAELDRLHEALGLEELIGIVAEEGIVSSEDLRAEMLADRSSAGWGRIVEGIYERERLVALFREAFDRELAGTDAGPLLAFYAGETGQKVRQLEIDARRAIVAEEVEAAAGLAYEALRAEGGARLDLLDDFVTANDLIGRNVAGAMNSNLAFYRGMDDGGGFQIGEAQALTEVWAQEEELRADTEAWVYAYVTMAYEPLGEGELGDYVRFSATEEGRDLNRAIFAGFYGIFDNVSYRLGHAVSTFVQGEEL